MRTVPHLTPGDTIGIVSPSSPSTFDSDIERLRLWADAQGFRLKVFPHARDRWGYLAGSDHDRAADLTAAFADPEVQAVLTMRGGTGGWRMVPHVDYDVLRANPKFFCGYSDTTALHLAIAKEAGFVTFYGPAGSSFIGRSRSTYTLRHFLRALTEPEPLGLVERDPDDPFTWAIRPGVAEGPLLGGCTTLLLASLGTPWEVDFRGAIVFFEDIGEEPYRMDNYLTQFGLAGKWDGIAGVIVGEHVDCGPRQFRPSYPTSGFSIEEVFVQHFEPLGVPVMVGLPCGHGRHLATLPLGARARLDAGAGTLEILEAATT
ncbi:MAG: LD-carboxypeptidase [Chloroflexi bacterium]|nr:MAG: LD-carboxypeptidase [Chloroflexota bacterium]